ncbi:MAG: acetylglutamate kinase [Phycisphaerales bacterium]|jgi:acetylglutamate kinase
MTTQNTLAQTGPVVVKLGGALLENAEALASLAQSLAVFDQAQPNRLVLIHGGGPIADKKLAAAGITLPKHNGLRATTPDAIGIIIESFKGLANAALVAALHNARMNPVGLTLTDGDTLTVSPKVIEGVDLGLVGTPRAADAGFINACLQAGQTPVLCSIGLAASNGWHNVNADEAAGALAEVLDAAAILLLSDIPAVLDAKGTPIPVLDEASIASLINAGTISGGMIPKVHAAIQAARAAGCPAIIASWSGADPVGSALSGSGVCTRVYAAQGVLA